MGNLLKVSHSEIHATLEALAHAGVQGEMFKEIRSNPAVAKAVAHTLYDFTEDDYADEENEEYKNVLYPEEYVILSIEEQIKILSSMFCLDSSYALEHARNLPKRPDGSEGWFATVSPFVCGGFSATLTHVMEKLVDERPFLSCSGKLVDYKNLNVLNTTARALDVFTKINGHILLIPAQFGSSRSFQSARRASRTFECGEFHLTPLEVASMLLTHPLRLSNSNKTFGDIPLNIEAAGAVQDIYSLCISFYQMDNKNKFEMHMGRKIPWGFGQATGFIPS